MSEKFNPMFDLDKSKMINATQHDYKIYGKNYIVEFSIHETKSDTFLPFALLEEGFHRHKQMSSRTTFAKTERLALNLLKEREEELFQRQSD